MKVHRSSPHHVPAHVAVFHRLRRLVMYCHNSVLHRGKEYPVNRHWHVANTVKWPHLAKRSRHELRGIQDALLLKSNSVRLTADELAYLRAANNHFDVRTCIGLLGGRDHADFGFKGVDQLHFGSRGHLCGCELVVVIEHHKARAGVIDKEHPHPPLRACRHHEDHADDLDRLHAYVADDHQSPEFLDLLEQERKAKQLGLPLPPKWAPPGRA